jgi:hypothetical protein
MSIPILPGGYLELLELLKREIAHRVRAGAVEGVAGTAAYRDLLDRLKQRIRDSQARAARTLNTELVMLYWSIGRDILDRQQAAGWGDDVVGRIAQDLAADVGSPRGFSRRNMFYMRRFAALWPDPEKVQPLSAQIWLVTSPGSTG